MKHELCVLVKKNCTFYYLLYKLQLGFEQNIDLKFDFTNNFKKYVTKRRIFQSGECYCSYLKVKSSQFSVIFSIFNLLLCLIIPFFIYYKQHVRFNKYYMFSVLKCGYKTTIAIYLSVVCGIDVTLLYNKTISCLLCEKNSCSSINVRTDTEIFV